MSKNGVKRTRIDTDKAIGALLIINLDYAIHFADGALRASSDAFFTLRAKAYPVATGFWEFTLDADCCFLRIVFLEMMKRTDQLTCPTTATP